MSFSGSTPERWRRGAAAALLLSALAAWPALTATARAAEENAAPAPTAAEAPAPLSSGTLHLLAPGSRLPSMVLQDRLGARHDIAVSAGGPVVLYFWSVFCPNCKEAFPALISFYGKWKDKGLTLWAVNVDGDRFSNAVAAFLDEAELPFPVAFDRLEGENLVAADPLGVSKTPTLYLADAQGKVLLRQAIDLDFGAVEKAVADGGSASR